MTARRAPVLAAAVGIAIVLLGSILCVSRVPQGMLGLRVPAAGGGFAELLGEGFHVHLPGDAPHLVPAGPQTYSGVLETLSSEGASLSQPFEARVDLTKASPAALTGLFARLETGASLQDAMTDLIRAAIDRAGRPGGSAGAESAPAPLSIGLVEGSLLLGKVRPIASGSHPLLATHSGPSHPVLIIGIDSADWDLMEPLMQAGRLPAMRRLRDRGAWGTLRSSTPTLSPILWTTIATGRPPEDHGVIDFLMKDPATGAEIPISRFFRKVKALWNIASDFDLASLTVGWWATWPAERVRGEMITDRVAYTLFDLPVGQAEAGATWPAELAKTVAALRLADDEVSFEEVRELCPIPQEAFDRARAALGTSAGYQDPVSHLLKILAGTATYHRLALDRIRADRPALTLVYYEGLDEVNHRFAHYTPPAMAMVRETPAELAAAYSAAVSGFYELQDRLVGELLEAAGSDVNVLVLSDHGFANGAERPLDAPPDIEGQPGLWHTLDGVLLAAGPSIRPGPIEGQAGLLDITPTILALLGLPPAQDMPGRVLSEILVPGAVPSPPSQPIASYDAIGEPLAQGGPMTSAMDQEMLARLAALGYIDAGEAAASAGSGTATYHVNAGHIFLGKGELEKARDSFARAREMAPRFDQPLLGLAQVELMSKRPRDAIPLLEEALKAQEEANPALLIKAARVYIDAGSIDPGLAFLGSLSARGRAEAHRLTAIGMLRESRGDKDGAAADFEAALGIDPSVDRALQGIYQYYRQRGELDRLAALLQGSLKVEPPRIAIRTANWVALIRERQGRREEGRAILTATLADHPHDVMTLTNLGGMYLREGEIERSLPLLIEAHQRSPGGLEVIVNLIVAHGRDGDLQAARRLFDDAAPRATRSGRRHLLNAIAYACHLNGRPGDARRFVEESLSLDPNQPDLLRLMAEIEGAGGR